MATIITREVGATAKGTTLTNAEIDNNFINLNNELSAKANTASPTLTGTVTVGKLSVLSPGGDEGGEINLALAQTNNLLNGSVAIDINQNQLRIFETGGTNRGVFINLASAGASVGTNLLANAPIAAADVPNLDASKITTGTIAAARLPSYVDDVLEAANLAAFPATGETGKIYVALDTNKTYRWSGSAYVYITSGAVDSVAGKTGVVTLVKGDVGLGSVDNTADSAKNVLSATKLTTARTIGGVSFDGTVNINLPGVNAAGNQNTTGNAGTATTLQTARNINGTSFNGSADITTANWGTARTLTIGNTGKSVNGSGNVSWSVAEIGAGTGHVYGYTATYSVPAAMAESWFKISDAYNSVVYFSISSSYDNTMHEDHVVATVFGYNMKHHLSSTTSDYNVGRLLEIKTNNNGSAGTTEIWARFGAATGAGQITIKSSHVIPTLVPATPTFGGTGIVSLLFDTTTRTTSSLLITRGIRIDGNVTLHAGNYNSYSPTLTGTGASGSWGISVTGSSASTTGNAATATVLQTARTINGVSFNGSANITVADSTKLPLTGGTLTGPLVVTSTGGSATDGLIVNSNGASGVHITPASGDTTQSGRLFFTTGTAGQGFSVRNSAGSLFIQSGATYGSSSGSTVALSLSQAGALNTAGAITQNGSQVLTAGNYNSYAPTLTGTGASGSWGISVTGNAATATTLQTARDINGTSFNGSANITTANWGTARTLTIGNTGKSVNGSANVTWTAQEIGVFPIVSGQVTISNAAFTNAFFVTGDALASAIRFTVHGTSGGNVIASTIDAVVNHSQDIMITSLSGVYTLLSVKIISNDNDQFVVQLSTNSATATTCNVQVQPLNSESVTFTGITAPTGSTLTHVCQPGYAISGTGGNSGDIRSAGTIYAPTFSGNLSGNASTVTNGLVSTGSYADPAWITSLASSKLTGTIDNARLNGGTYTINVTGNAGTATTLQTARTLTIGSTGKTFNGSANVAWSLAEIGALGASAKAADSELLDGYNSDRFLRTYSDSSMESGVHGGNLNGTNMQYLLAREQVQNLVAYVAPTSYETWNGSAWVSATVPTAIFRNKPTNNWGGLTIANGVTKVRFTWLSFGYKFWSTLATAGSTNGNSFRARIYTSSDNVTWIERFVSGYVTDWPGYHVWPTYYGDSAFPHMRIELEFTYVNANTCTFGDIALWGSYGTYTPLFDWDYSRNITLGGDLQLLDKFLRFDQSGTRSWNIRATGGNLDVASGDGLGSLRYNGNAVLTTGTYNSYAPSLTGTGASGSWGISVTGNAGTATALQTARTINGVSFNGSANITVADATKLPLAGGTLTGGLQVGYGGGDLTIRATAANDLGDLVWADYAGTEKHRIWDGGTGLQYRKDGGAGYMLVHTGNYNSYSPTLTGTGASGSWGISITGSSASTTGNAATATALQTARTINGVSFNGSANITVADATKLPLAGGTLTGELTIATGAATGLRINTSTGTQSLWVRAGYDSDGTATPVVSATNIQFQSSGSSGGTFSFVSGNTKSLTIGSVVNSLVALQQTGNQVLHAGNVSTYALPIGGGTLTGALNLAALENTLVAQHDGNTAVWRGRILSKNATSDRAAFLGTYAGIAGVFAHNNALNAWADLYVNTSDGTNGGTVRTTTSVLMGGNQALHAGNYNSYSPTLTGGGASGSWGISVTGSSASTTGNAATATALQTARTIGGVSFNGTANINLPGVNAAGNQNTSGTATNATNTTITNDTTTTTAQFVTFVGASSGNTGQKTHSTGLTFIPSTGALTASGNITAYSDESLKKDWAPVATDFVVQLANIKHGTYTRIDSGERQAGASAQDWQKLLPETVLQGSDGKLSLAYGNAALVSAIQLAQDNLELRARIDRLESLIELILNKE